MIQAHEGGKSKIESGLASPKFLLTWFLSHSSSSVVARNGQCNCDYGNVHFSPFCFVAFPSHSNSRIIQFGVAPASSWAFRVRKMNGWNMQTSCAIAHKCPLGTAKQTSPLFRRMLCVITFTIERFTKAFLRSSRLNQRPEAESGLDLSIMMSCWMPKPQWYIIFLQQGFHITKNSPSTWMNANGLNFQFAENFQLKGRKKGKTERKRITQVSHRTTTGKYSSFSSIIIFHNVVSQ